MRNHREAKPGRTQLDIIHHRWSAKKDHALGGRAPRFQSGQLSIHIPALGDAQGLRASGIKDHLPCGLGFTSRLCEHEPITVITRTTTSTSRVSIQHLELHARRSGEVVL